MSTAYEIRLGEDATLVEIADALTDAAPTGVAYECVGGAITMMTTPGEAHARVYDALVLLLAPWSAPRGPNDPGGWIIRPTLHCHFARCSENAIPDRVGWRRERVAGDLPRCPHGKFTAADWICEILSPGAENHRRDRVTKLQSYARGGVAHYWVLDPEAQTLEVYRLVGESYGRVATFEGARAVRAEPFDTAPLDLATLWA